MVGYKAFSFWGEIDGAAQLPATQHCIESITWEDLRAPTHPRQPASSAAAFTSGDSNGTLVSLERLRFGVEVVVFLVLFLIVKVGVAGRERRRRQY